MNINWADPPAWGAFGVSLIALGVAWRGQHRANQSASKSADASVRAAVAAEQALALQQQQAAEATAAAAPRPELVIQRGSGSSYLLRNVGTAPAVDVEIDVSQVTGIARGLEGRMTLQPGEGHRMVIAGSMGSPMPTALPVRWEGQGEYRMLPMPPR